MSSVIRIEVEDWEALRLAQLAQLQGVSVEEEARIAVHRFVGFNELPVGLPEATDLL